MNIVFHRDCIKDLKHWKAAGWKMESFKAFLDDCGGSWPLSRKYELHMLHGEKESIWDIHIRQNWLVLVKRNGDTITLLRTGTHAYLGIA